MHASGERLPYLEEFSRVVKTYDRNAPKEIWHACKLCDGPLYQTEGMPHGVYDLILCYYQGPNETRWSRNWAHAICIEDSLLRWVGWTDEWHERINRTLTPAWTSKRVLAQERADRTWVLWLRLRADYLYYPSADERYRLDNKPRMDKVQNKLRELDIKLRRRQYDLPFRDMEVARLVRTRAATHVLLCLWELGLPSDLAWPIVALAYWIL